MDALRFLENVRNGIQKRGRKELIAHLEGKHITKQQAILAKCYDCTGFYADRDRDCHCSTCPLYPYMPYNPNKYKVASAGKIRRSGGGRDAELSEERRV